MRTDFEAWECDTNGGKLWSVFLQILTFRVPMNYFQNILQLFSVSVNLVPWHLSVFKKYIVSVCVCVCVCGEGGGFCKSVRFGLWFITLQL